VAGPPVSERARSRVPLPRPLCPLLPSSETADGPGTKPGLGLVQLRLLGAQPAAGPATGAGNDITAELGL
jgi:hypothetical protein